jgi:hypothetical protein
MVLLNLLKKYVMMVDVPEEELKVIAEHQKLKMNAREFLAPRLEQMIFDYQVILLKKYVMKLAVFRIIFDFLVQVSQVVDEHQMKLVLWWLVMLLGLPVMIGVQEE